MTDRLPELEDTTLHDLGDTPRRLDREALRALALLDPPLRPRLLSHVGRWGRALRWLPPESQWVLDVGSSFGYGTAALTGSGSRRRTVIGVEADETHVSEARRRFPWVTVLAGEATNLLIEDGVMDGVTMLDVLEHVDDPHAAIAELRRVLRPDGVLVLSVPHRGLLTCLDSLNAYPALRRRWPSWPPLDSAEASASGTHRHFTVDELTAMLRPHFKVEKVARTGLGVAELVHLIGLVVFKALLGWPRAYRAAMGFHLVVYLLDDAVRWGAMSYYVTVRARAAEAGR